MKCQDDVLKCNFTEASRAHLSTSAAVLLIVSFEGLSVSILPRAISEQDRSVRRPLLFSTKKHKRMIQSFAFVSEQRSFVCNVVPAKPSNEPSGTMVHVWAIIIRPLKQRPKHGSVRSEFKNRVVTWQAGSHPDVFPSVISARLQQERIRSVFLHHWSLWRGLRIFQGPRPTKVPARYLHVNKPPLRNYCWCFCALPLQNLTANYAMATLSTPFARMLIITVPLSSFLPSPFTSCPSNPGSPRNTSVLRHLPLSVIPLWCDSCFISIPPKGCSSRWGC